MKPRFVIIAGYGDSLTNFRGHLIQDLMTSGFEVHAIAPEPSSKNRRKLQDWGVHLHTVRLSRTSFNPLRDLLFLFDLIAALRKIRPDVVLSYTIKAVIYGSIAAKLVGARQVYAMITGMGYAFGAAGVRGRILSKFVSLLYRIGLLNISGVLFQNPDDLAEFRRRGILSSVQRTTVVNGSGVDVENFAVAPLPGEVSFLLIARLTKEKGVFEYVEAARRIRMLHPTCQFYLVGWIDENPSSIFQSDLDCWIKENVIIFWGKLDDVRPAIAKTAVYVLPSYSEGLPRTVLEAMAMGRPIITTDAPGCRETVIDGENGYLVKAGSSDELILAMQRYIDDPAKIHAMGEASRKIAFNKFDVKKVNASIMNFLGIEYGKIDAKISTHKNASS